jgi:hypothetical protein
MGEKGAEVGTCAFCRTEQPARNLRKCIKCGQDYCSVCKNRTPWKYFVVKTDAGYVCQECMRLDKVCGVCGASEGAARCESCGGRTCPGCMTECSSCRKPVCKKCIEPGYSYCTACYTRMMSYRGGPE